MKKTVAGILKAKGSDVWSVSPDATVRVALELMAEHDVGALAVIADDRLVGIMSERDYARKVILLHRGSQETKVSDIMTSEVVTVRPDESLAGCMEVMTDRRIRHLPVVDDEAIVGVISIGDVVKSVITEQRFLIEQLEQYITG